MVRIEISGDIRPAGRPRFTRGGHAYQPAQNREVRQMIQAAARSAMKNQTPMTGEVSAVVQIYRRRKVTAKNFGDVDNFLKAVLDALNGICYSDDSQVVRCVVEKFCDKDNPRALVELRELTNKS